MSHAVRKDATLSIQGVRQAVADGELDLIKVVQGFLDRISATSSLNIYLETWEDEALEEADRIQKAIRNGTAGRLAGAVISLKDNLCYRGHRVGASSQILEGFESIYTATSVQRLLDEDAILIGRTNCDEFAMGSSNENSAFGPVSLPHDPELVPGGSSGGAAASVAAGTCHVALGSDTGGSIRQPASFCGIIGLKPTYGRISRYGLIAYASSFDQIGPLGHHASDTRLVYEVMTGLDPMDNTSADKELHPEGHDRPIKRIAYLQDCLTHEGLSPEIKESFQNRVDALREAGFELDPVSFPLLDEMIPTYYVLTTAEASSNLARFDGIHYGYRSEQAQDIDTTYLYSRSEGFGPEVKRRIMLGTFVLSSGYYDAYYSKAQKVRRLIREATLDILSRYDLIMTPSTPHAAFKQGSVKDPIAMYLEDIFTVQANLCGCPAISLPLDENASNLPFGTQFMAAPFQEDRLFQMAEHLSIS